MNRKQRRALGHSGAGTARGGTNAAAASDIAKMLAAAVAQHRAGALADAERRYRDILVLDPGHAETHSRLGAVLMAQGKTGQAIPQFERALALDPDLFEALGNLAQAYLAAGQNVEAVMAAFRAIELRETPPGKTLFAHCARHAVFRSDQDGRARKLMLRALLEDWAPPRELTGAAVSLVRLNRGVTACIERSDAAWPRRLSAAELLGLPDMAEAAGDRLLCALLKRDPVGDVGVERLLTNVRSAVLSAAAAQDGSDDAQARWNGDLLAFFCAVAQQCFLNEYVYALDESEAAKARELQSALADKIKAGEPIPTLWIAAVAAYFPLHVLPNAAMLGEKAWPECIEALVVQQIREPAEERQIAATLPALTSIESEVSQAVRRQYEENPYPRWVRTAPPQRMPTFNGPISGPAQNLLIAGCGTGLSLVEMSPALAGARVLAIDLSRASLSYAARMARKFGLAGIAFAQADILKLGSLGREFDFIDCSGVLHHLADPWEGWRVLLSLLRPGGTMQVGLYSAVARANVIAARALIAERGYLPTAHDIRRCRQDIVASGDPLLKSLIRSRDFFTTSECRDLLFHVQEVRITLPEIKSFLAANSLRFLGFTLEPTVLQRFSARFPDRAALTDLDRWHAFETEAPATFAGMYQFQVQKPPQRPDAGIQRSG